MDRDVIAEANADQAQIERNGEYYRDGFRNISKIIDIQAFLIVVLTFFFAFLVATHKNNDRYFAQTAEGRKMQMQGLDYPNMGREAMETWVAAAVTQVMTFGFNDVDERFSLSRSNFTDNGWDSFVAAMVAAKTVSLVIDGQLIITSVLLSTPTLLKEGLIKDVYTWEYNMKVLVTMRAGGVKKSQTKTVYVAVERVPTSENPNGVGIGRWMLY